MFVSVIVPCYRSASTIPRLVSQLDKVMAGCATAYEIILVVDDDGDDTWGVAAGLVMRHASVEAIRLARNYGQHNALVAGARAARYDILVTMDDDLQHPPAEVPTLLRALTPDVDLVYGVPVREEHGPLRSLASRLVKAGLSSMLGVRNAKTISAFRVFRSFLCEGLHQIAGPHVSVDVALGWGTTRVATATVQMRTRETGRSGYTLRALLRHTGNMLLGYSTAPLRLVTYVGFAAGALGLALLARVVFSYLNGATTVPGYTTIASMLALFSAAQLVALGVLGEYVGRVHVHGMGRPTYVIRERAPGGAARPDVGRGTETTSTVASPAPPRKPTP